MTIKKKRTSPSSRLVTLVIPLIMAALSMACIFSGINIGGTNSLEVTVGMKENTINRLLRHSFTGQVDDEDNLLGDITSVDLQPGLIRVFGTYTRSDGSEVPGSADLTFSVKDGMLAAEIIAVDIAGLDVNHPRITRINDLLAREFAESASDRDQVEFISVTITEDEVEFVIEVTPDQ